MKRILSVALVSLLWLAACSEPVSQDARARILVMGDSMLAAHSLSGRSVAGVLERKLGVEIVDRSVSGARMIYRLPISGAAGLNIPKQFRDGPWEEVIVNGGGNDLWLGCGCHACARKLDKLAAKDGSAKGEIPALIGRLRKTGARVIWVGYLRSPGVGSPIESCKDEGDELERRIAAFAERTEGVTFVSLADMVPNGDRSYHGFDMIHPSVKGSAAIAERVAAALRD